MVWCSRSPFLRSFHVWHLKFISIQRSLVPSCHLSSLVVPHCHFTCMIIFEMFKLVFRFVCFARTSLCSATVCWKVVLPHAAFVPTPVIITRDVGLWILMQWLYTFYLSLYCLLLIYKKSFVLWLLTAYSPHTNKFWVCLLVALGLFVMTFLYRQPCHLMTKTIGFVSTLNSFSWYSALARR